jgi:hypothetical protein
LFLSGHGSQENNYLPQVFVNDGSGKFIESKIPPAVPGYGLALDAIYKDGYFYILRTTDTGLTFGDNFYSATLLQKVKYPEMTSSSAIYSFDGRYINGSTWVNWIGFNGENVVSLDADYELKVPK